MSSGSYGEVPGSEKADTSAKATVVICGLGALALFVWSMAVLGFVHLIGMLG